MTRTITQRELRNDSGGVMRAVEAGATFIVTRNGVPVAELRPVRTRIFVSRDQLRAALRHAPQIDPARFRADLDAVVDQTVPQ
ncbi:MAG: type II toxin-antitoxin system Phd/YefM family antitoxin [Egibacteraceae bacterium]